MVIKTKFSLGDKVINKLVEERTSPVYYISEITISFSGFILYKCISINAGQMNSVFFQEDELALA